MNCSPCVEASAAGARTETASASVTRTSARRSKRAKGRIETPFLERHHRGQWSGLVVASSWRWLELGKISGFRPSSTNRIVPQLSIKASHRGIKIDGTSLHPLHRLISLGAQVEQR